MKTLTHPMLTLGLAAAFSAITIISNTTAEARVVAPTFNSYDSNANGLISLEEFQAQGGLVKAFHDGDLNRDLLLSKDELAHASASNERILSTHDIDDAWITTKVETMLLKDDIVKGLNVNVATTKGMVQLSGWVDTEARIAQLEQLALGIDGVKSVRNDLQLNKR